MIEQPAHTYMLGSYSEATVANALRPDHLELIILPTEKCNFRCTYCYESFVHGKMPSNVVSAVKAFLRRRIPALTSLSLSWFGGEPLLAQDVIAEIGTIAFEDCNKHGVSFSGGLTTNGYKLDSDCFFALNRISHSNFQITLDGTEARHNTTRRRADGAGTFEKIWQNLLAMQATDTQFHTTLRIHVSNSNLHDIRDLCIAISEQFGADERFSVHFHRISDLGGPGFRDEISMRDYRAALSELHSLVGVRSTSEVSLIDSNEICYAAKINSLLIRSDGRIGKCTVALEDDRNTIGKVREDGLLDIDNDKLRIWMNGFRDMDVQSLGCPLSNLNDREPSSQIAEPVNNNRIPVSLSF